MVAGLQLLGPPESSRRFFESFRKFKVPTSGENEIIIAQGGSKGGGQGGPGPPSILGSGPPKNEKN